MAAGTHDEALIRAVYDEHGKAMLSYARRLLLGDAAAAEDVVQEALVRVWRHPESLTNGKGSVRGWLLTIVRNLVIDRARARAARPSEISEALEQPPVVEDHAPTTVALADLWTALETLSEAHRRVLVELYLHDRPFPEVAAALGVPPGTVKSRMYYALRAVRRALEPQLGPTSLAPDPMSQPMLRPRPRPSPRPSPRPRPRPAARRGDQGAGVRDDLQVGGGP